MMTVNSKCSFLHQLFQKWGVVFVVVSFMLPAVTISQNQPDKDHIDKLRQQIGVCGGVMLKAVEVPEELAKPIVALFRINPTFDPNVTAAQRAVFQQAINEWDALIDSSGFNPGDYPIRFRYGPLNPSFVLARTTTTFNSGNGNLISAEIVFDNDGSNNWYEDPNPADDSEFQKSPPTGYDLLSVARHEIGHAIGWTITARVASLMSGDIFDPTLLNIATAGDTGHTDPKIHVNDLMNPAIGEGIRRPISLYPSVAMVSQSFHYWIFQLRCVANTNNVRQTGSVYQPWSKVQVGVMDTPANGLLIIGSGTYNERVQSMRVAGTRLEIITPRGGNAVILGQ